jgi:hypothetical protein
MKNLSLNILVILLLPITVPFILLTNYDNVWGEAIKQIKG